MYRQSFMPVDHLDFRPRIECVSAIYRGQKTIFIKSSGSIRLEPGEPNLIDYSHTLFMPGNLETTGRHCFQPSHKEKSRALLHLDAAAQSKWP